MEDYSLLDSGEGAKLERFGDIVVSRPCGVALWRRQKPKLWKSADAVFEREGSGYWHRRPPESWTVEIAGLRFHLRPTDFGHLGVFPEHSAAWQWIEEVVARSGRQDLSILNLFAYSGGATLAAARAGASVCHLDASKGMVSWARDNAALNGMEDKPVRWIVDDVTRFLEREKRRGRRYDGIILDPPSFGRGSKGEVFKIEEEMAPLLDSCRKLLSDQPLFLFLSCHTPGFTPIVLNHFLQDATKGLGGKIEQGELALPGKDVLPLPNGTYARWSI